VGLSADRSPRLRRHSCDGIESQSPGPGDMGGPLRSAHLLLPAHPADMGMPKLLGPPLGMVAPPAASPDVPPALLKLGFRQYVTAKLEVSCVRRVWEFVLRVCEK
jgi:hypothetical protein